MHCVTRLILTIFVASLLGVLVQPNDALASQLPLKISANAAILIDQHTGRIIYQKNATEARHPASLTKIMTAIINIEAKINQEEAVVSKRAGSMDLGSSLELQSGDRLLVGDLLKAALLVSANDSTVVLAENYAGNHDIFVYLMNTKAFLLGCNQTNYVNTNGFSKPNHLTTAKDLAIIARHCLQNPQFAALVATKEDAISLTHKNGKVRNIPLRNTNRLLRSYPGTNGVKTGTTSKAGNCLLTSVSRNEHQLIAVVLKSKNRYADTEKLMEYGFSQ